MKRIGNSLCCPHGSNGKNSIKTSICHECLDSGDGKRFSYCEICHRNWHVGCVTSSPIVINHPYHPYHPLKFIIDVPPEYYGKCDTCGGRFKRYFYYCSICDYSMHVKCSKDPPPLVVNAPKCHEHTLTLMVRNDRFTCNACGMYGEQCPYVCAPCSLMFHRDCITLPHIININRHDDRISHTYTIGFGDYKCTICQKKIDWRYGVYSCVKYPSYVVHSKCATRHDVWDGVELEGVPEEIFDVSPFKVIEDGVINHFSHQKHNLRIVEDGIERDKSVRCEGCTHPIFSEKYYSCMECNYTLHETCANLPLRKRHGLSPTPFTLEIYTKKDKNTKYFNCDACNQISNGFRYKSGDIELDVRCAMISYYCDYECHPHPLYLTTTGYGTCGGCHKKYVNVLDCVECGYLLCFECATLPKKIRNRCDDHFLLLRYGEKAEGKYWCEICETVLDPKEWFYTCDDCVVVCHIKCVFGDYVNAKPGIIIMGDEEKAELVSNQSMSRPKCSSCGSRCQFPIILSYFSYGIEYVRCKSGCENNW